MNVDETYWGHGGPHQSLVKAVQELVPDSGPCGCDQPHLERFRRVSNAYYDLWNNGGCNLGSDIRHYFGIVEGELCLVGTPRDGELFRRTEPVVESALLHAAAEANLVGRRSEVERTAARCVRHFVMNVRKYDELTREERALVGSPAAFRELRSWVEERLC